ILLIVLIQPIMSALSNFEMFSTYGSNYNLELESIGIGNIILKLPVILIIILNTTKLKKSNNKIYRLTIIYYLGLILEYLGYFASYVGRIAIYYDMIQIFILAAI